MADKRNLVINGSGSSGGGSFHKINIRGEGTITTDFDCEIFKTFGTSGILKNGKANKFEIFGETEVHGNLDSQQMKIFGTTEVDGSVHVGKAKVWGTLEVGKGFYGEEADIKGSLSVKGDAEFETFRSSGAFDIKGLLNAGTIEVNVRYGQSSANEIGGDKITVKKKRSFFPFMKGEGSLQVKIIEGDDIFLENTIADIVRGNNVQIGSGCEIKMVEYKNSYKVNPESTVVEYKKMS
ncbi:MAG TPA: cytoplasmic protein [Pseudoneobacillus sp.]|nr:cytoplasmic protein [Pseudoneobacillus sp.]